MMKNVWLCLLLCAFAASSPFHATRVFAQDDDAVDFDEVTMDEDADSAKTSTADAATDDDDFESEFADDEPADAQPEAAKPKVANKVEDDEQVIEDEPEMKSDTASSDVDELEPAPPATEPEEEPELAAPSPEATPQPEEMAPAQPAPEPSIVQNNDPDLEYEAKLYDIYVNYTSTRTPEDQWRGLVGERQDERYKIQKGDTLWDISQTLFGDGNYWPKIWSLNSTITNPHVIEPGNSIRFLLGDESGPPAFTVSESESEAPAPPTVPQQARFDGDAGTSDEPDIPPPSRAYRPVMKKLPPSLPNWQDPEAYTKQFDDAGISYGRRKIADIADAIPLAAYITEELPKPLGEVTEVETGFNMASALQYVYVRMAPGQGDVGDVFLSVFNKGAIKVDKKIISEKSLGYGMEVLGEIQLIEQVRSESHGDKKGNVYRALVTKTVSPVEVGSSLIVGKIEEVDLSEKGRKSQIVAQIMGGQFAPDRKLYGPQSFAFLNRGSSDGVEVGQILPVRANRKARDPKSAVLANIRSIGWLKVVRTTEKFSTAVVLRSWDEIVTGDFTGSGDGINLAHDIGGDVGAAPKTSMNDVLGDEGTTADDKAESEDQGIDGDTSDGFSDDFGE